MKKVITALGLIALIFYSNISKGQDTIVSWTFPGGTAADSMVTNAIPINANSFIRTQGGTSAIDFTKNGLTTKAAQAIGWNSGTNQKSWLIEFNTTGFKDLDLYSKQQSGGGNPGPKDFKLQYKIGTVGVWTNIAGGKITVANDWTTGVVNKLRLPDTLNNRSDSVYLRWVMASDTSTSLKPVVSTGISKIDDIYILANKITTNIFQEKIANDISVWPNPTARYLQIKSRKNINQMEILNITGKILLSRAVEVGKNEINLDLNPIGKGMFFIRISGNKETFTKKIVVE